MMERRERYHFVVWVWAVVLGMMIVGTFHDREFNERIDLDARSNSSINHHHTVPGPTLACRITIQRTLYEQDIGDDVYEEEELVCRSIVDGSYGKELIIRGDVLPGHFYKKHELAIAQGDLYASLKGITVQNGKIIAGQEGVEIELIDNPNSIMPVQGRRLMRNASDAPFGTWTIAIVRISTPDSEVSVSKKELRQKIFGDGLNAISQYHDMSFGQFILQPAGVFDVYMNQSISLFETASDTIDHVQQSIAEQLELEDPWDLADKVMVCLPIGLRVGFTAFTSAGHWRAMYSDDWCTSLSGMIHEIAHMFGLGHSHVKNYDYQDTSCYLSVTSRSSDSPRQAFNGAKHFKLQWYHQRTLTIEPLGQIDAANSRNIFSPIPPRLIQLAAFVDFNKTKRHQPVLLSIDDVYFVQYNRAKGFNNETRSMVDRVTITAISGELLATERKAGLSPRSRHLSDEEGESLYIQSNYRKSGHDLHIQVCFEYPGNDTRPDLMIISVGLDYSLCRGGDT